MTKECIEEPSRMHCSTRVVRPPKGELGPEQACGGGYGGVCVCTVRDSAAAKQLDGKFRIFTSLSDDGAESGRRVVGLL